MKIVEQFADNVEVEDRDSLRRHMLHDNIRRGRTLAMVVIGFEVCFAALDIATSIMKVDSRFHFTLYLMMYVLMIGMNVLFLAVTGRVKEGAASLPEKQVAAMERFITAYILFMMCWGSIVSLMDQKLYGQLMVFMVNMVTCSIIYYQDKRKMLLPYIASTALLALGLPFFQHSGDVLIGHYVNLMVFIVVTWTASRIIYQRYLADHRRTELLEQANRQLEDEIKQNRTINLELAEANQQLVSLSLLDELTGIPNRRSFRGFIDRMFDGHVGEGTTFSVVMVDVDCFKEYNDRYGHNEGDKVVSKVSSQVHSVVRHSMDIAARWGGDEFIYAAFDRSHEEMNEAAEGIRAGVNRLAIPHEHCGATGLLSVSVGLSTINVKDKGDISKCIERADRAMYRSKAGGRDRIEWM